jgi:hypothetical protein
MFCPNCGANVNNASRFCSECGTDIATNVIPQETPPPMPQETSPTVPPPPPPKPQPVAPPPPQYIPQPKYQSKLPPVFDDRPMSVGQWILTFIILAIPIVGIIMIFVWALGSTANLNKRNFSRAILIMWIIGIVIGIVFAIITASTLSSLMQQLK